MQRNTGNDFDLQPSTARPVSQGIKFGSTQRLEMTNHNLIYVPEYEKCIRAGQINAGSKGGEAETRSRRNAEATTGENVR
jgi:hypothetical protein